MARLSSSGAHRSRPVSFIGRSRDIDNARRRLEASRLVTLTGTGGVGKTSIASELAHRIARTFSDGVWFIELDGISQSVDLATAVTSALQIQVDDDDPEHSLVDYFATTASLLVFDNCEHLLDDCARLISVLLNRCPGIRILATSREPLGLLAESVQVVSPLPVADLPAAMPSANRADLPTASSGHNTRRPRGEDDGDAVTLFLDRARSAVPDFSASADDECTIREICARLEGLPLAIELAAVRLRVLSPGQILAHLDDQLGLLTQGHRDLPHRQRALRSSIEWSYGLCSDRERWLWSQLSVFAPSWNLAAAHAIAGAAGLSAHTVLDVVQSLVEKSIVTRYRDGDDVWFGMLSSIREFGWEKLDDSGQLHFARLQHRDWYLTVVRAAEIDWIGAHQNRWLRLFQREIVNIRAAIEFSLTTEGEEESALELTVVAWRICWQASLRTTEHRSWLERALAVAPRESELRAYGLALHGGIAKALGDVETAHSDLAAAVTIAERLQNSPEDPHVEIIRGAFAETLPDSAESLALRVAGARAQWAHPELTARTQSVLRLAQMYDRTGEFDRAAALRQSAIALGERTGERYESSYLFLYSGLAAAERHDGAAATALTRQALILKRDLEHPVGFAHAFEVLAAVSDISDNPSRAAQLLGAAVTAWRDSGSPLSNQVQFAAERTATQREAKQHLGDTEFDREFDRGSRLSRAEAIALALGETVDRSGAVTPSGQPDGSPTPLTARERQVAALVADGLSDKQIAATLFISQRTAEGHVQRALGKLGFNSRTQLGVWASTAGS